MTMPWIRERRLRARASSALLVGCGLAITAATATAACNASRAAHPSAPPRASAAPHATSARGEAQARLRSAVAHAEGRFNLEVTGSAAHAQLTRIAQDATLLAALRAGRFAAALAEADRQLIHHVVRIRVSRGSRAARRRQPLVLLGRRAGARAAPARRLGARTAAHHDPGRARLRQARPQVHPRRAARARPAGRGRHLAARPLAPLPTGRRLRDRRRRSYLTFVPSASGASPGTRSPSGSWSRPSRPACVEPATGPRRRPSLASRPATATGTGRRSCGADARARRCPRPQPPPAARAGSRRARSPAGCPDRRPRARPVARAGT